jgi:type VI secretion system protein ImpJ
VDDTQRVLWTEGLFITPQHFQQADRYTAAQFDRLARIACPISHGVAEQTVDVHSAEGTVGVSRFRGILPDGTMIDAPTFDEPPASRDVRSHLGADTEKIGVYLAVPVHRERTPLSSDTGAADGRPTRLRTHTVTVRDSATGTDPRQVRTAVTNLRLLFDGESHDDHATIKIAEVVKTPDGGLATSERFMPPSFCIGTAPRILRAIKRIIDMVVATHEELGGQLSRRGGGLVELTASETTIFLFMHALSGALPRLRHVHHSPWMHPEQVYAELAGFAGQLSAFAGDGKPPELPPYNHDAPYPVFAKLTSAIDKLLAGGSPQTRVVPLPLKHRTAGIYTARVQDDRLFSGKFYLVVASNVPQQKVATEVPLKAKATSSHKIEKLLSQALRGLSLSHLAVPPSEIPVQPNRTYFEIDQSGEHWKAIEQGKSIAFYFPPEFTELSVEILIVKGT